MSVNESITEYFSDPISAMDESILGRGARTSEGQQAWEFLAILVALRLWNSQGRQVQLKFVGDNTGALNRALKLRPKCKTMAIMAREIALAISHMSFPPVMEQTPGVAHILADRLSSADPAIDPDLVMHLALINASLSYPSVRNKAWYSTLAKFRG